MVKKSCFDVCGGDCEVCFNFGLKSLTSVPVLTKRKVHKKFVPPDMTAIKMLVEKEDDGVDLESMSDEELKVLEQKLLKNLIGNTKDG